MLVNGGNVALPKLTIYRFLANEVVFPGTVFFTSFFMFITLFIFTPLNIYKNHWLMPYYFIPFERAIDNGEVQQVVLVGYVNTLVFISLVIIFKTIGLYVSYRLRVYVFGQTKVMRPSKFMYDEHGVKIGVRPVYTRDGRFITNTLVEKADVE